MSRNEGLVWRISRVMLCSKSNKVWFFEVAVHGGIRKFFVVNHTEKSIKIKQIQRRVFIDIESKDLLTNVILQELTELAESLYMVNLKGKKAFIELDSLWNKYF